MTDGHCRPISSHVRARRCPRAIAATWAWQTAVALVVAWPAASLVGRSFGADPRGDATLWDAGGRPLLAVLTRDSHAVHAEATLASIVLVTAAVAGLLPTAALMAAMLDPGRGRARSAAARAAARAVRVLPAFGVVLLVIVLAQGAAVAAAWLASKVVDLYVRDGLGEARADWIEALVVLPVVLPIAALSIVHDLSRAAALRFRAGAVRAMSLGARALRRTPWSTAWGWGWRQAASLSAIAAAAPVAGWLGGRRGLALVAVALAHQAAIALRVALRASWLAKALRTVAE